MKFNDGKNQSEDRVIDPTATGKEPIIDASDVINTTQLGLSKEAQDPKSVRVSETQIPLYENINDGATVRVSKVNIDIVNTVRAYDIRVSDEQQSI